MIDKVIKRDGSVVDFDRTRIYNAIKKAIISCGGSDFTILDKFVDNVIFNLGPVTVASVEEIQDAIEHVLVKSRCDKVSKEFISYRYKRNLARQHDYELMSILKDLTIKDPNDNDLKRENANINGNTSMGLMLKYGSESSKVFCKNYILKDSIREAYDSGYIHIHDLDFEPMGTATCVSPNSLIEVNNGYVRACDIDESFIGNHLGSGKDEAVLLDIIPSYKEEEIYSIYAKGAFIEVTGDHRVPTLNRGLVFAKDLRVGDVLDTDTRVGWLGKRTSINLNEILDISDWVIDKSGAHPCDSNVGQCHKNPIPLEYPLDYGFGRLLGLVASDGRLCKDKVLFINKDMALIDETISLFRKYFPNCTVYDSYHCGYYRYISLYGPLSVKVFDFFLSKRSSCDMRLNRIFFESSEEFAKGFLSGYLDGNGNHFYPFKLSWSGSCEVLMKDISRLLSALGLRNTIRNTHSKGTKASWRGHKDSVRTSDIYCVEVTGSDYDNARQALQGSFKNDRYKIISHKRRPSKYGVVKSIEKSLYKGFVYDFTSTTHYFNSDFVRVHNCVQIDLKRILKEGFSTGHGYLREPNSIGTASALTCIIIQSDQNDQHGGQAIPNFEYGLAPYVVKSYVKILTDYFEFLVDKSSNDFRLFLNRVYDMNKTLLSEEATSKIKEYFLDIGVSEMAANKILDRSFSKIERETFQAMEALIHNLNTMHSRAGAQVPFSSLNYGTGILPEERLVIKSILLAIDRGLGKGETAIFPISIFKVKEGVNFNPEDPNYDLFKLACEVSSRRLFPNFSFLDSPFNLKYYDGTPESEAVYMGCRTRILADVTSEEQSAFGRGNLSFTSINLPRLAIESNKNVDKFFSLLNKYQDLVFDQLLERFKIQSSKKVKNFPFLMGQGVWKGSKNLDSEDTIGEVLKTGSLTVGFIGLAEALVSLIGCHHGESDEAQDLGLKIISFMRDKCDKKSEEMGMNFTLIATPAEGLSGRFLRLDKGKYGEIKGVTDKDYYTNSFHIPVSFNISIKDKIRKEAPYHNLTNGGHITYVELSGDVSKNPYVYEDIIRYMKEQGIGYGSINHEASDYDPVCGYHGYIGDVCPFCGRVESDPLTKEQIAMWKRQKVAELVVGEVALNERG